MLTSTQDKNLQNDVYVLTDIGHFIIGKASGGI